MDQEDAIVPLEAAAKALETASSSREQGSARKRVLTEATSGTSSATSSPQRTGPASVLVQVQVATTAVKVASPLGGEDEIMCLIFRGDGTNGGEFRMATTGPANHIQDAAGSMNGRRLPMEVSEHCFAATPQMVFKLGQALANHNDISDEIATIPG